MRGSLRPLVMAVALALAALAAAAVVHVRRAGEAPDAAMDRALNGVQRDLHVLVTEAQASAAAAATDAATIPALAGGASERAALFRQLDALLATRRTAVAIAVRSADGTPVAWAGRASVLPDLPSPDGPEVFVLHGAVTSTLVARVPVRGGDGRLLGVATAERLLAVRRHIRNAYIGDFDLLARDPSTQVLYVDVHEPAVSALPPTPVPHRDAVLSSPQGRPLAVVRVTPEATDARRALLVTRYRAAASAVVLAALLLVAVAVLRCAAPLGRLTVVALAARATLLALGWPWPEPTGLLSPDVFSHPPLPAALARHPLDLLATAAVLAALAAWAADRLRRSAPSSPRAARLGGVLLAAPVVLAAALGAVVRVVRHTRLDLQPVRIWPETPAHLAIHAALLLVLVAAALLVAGGVTWAGVRLGRWQGRSLAARVTALLVLVAVLAGLLHALLRRETMALVRTRIRTEHAAAVLRQPTWRAEVLAATQRQLDALRVLEETRPGASTTGVDELAFALWSSTDLAAYGFSSAVEIQDPGGAVVSRFALNLPTLAGGERPLPASADWQVSRESLRLGSAERPALHAGRQLRYHGELHGALHVDLAEDYWNLPFLIGRDPYSVLFRTGAPASASDPTVHLVAWRNDEVVFSSLERAPSLPAGAAPGRWSRLAIDDVPHEAWVFGDGATRYALLHPTLGAGRYAADLVEAVVALTLLAAVVLALCVLALGALGHPELSLASVVAAVQRRFVLRLFVAFTLVAVLPVAVLQVVLRSFVVERLRLEAREQALERAAVARKVVQDYATARQAGESAVTDAALVLVSSFVQNDLDLFQDGRLLASSKRELYASGLLPERAPGSVHRALVLENQPWVLGTETIGAFSYLVASVPVTIDPQTTGVLSIPLPLPQRELEATVQDLSRTLRLASVVFLALAAVLAHGLARRISGPIQDLTRATRRVAQGDLEARVTPHSRDELRDLVEAFNTMAGDLDRQRRDLERSNRLAAWAEMARQVAHEVKNPLTPIQLSTEHLRRVWHSGAKDFDATLDVCTQTILKQVRTLRGMVTEFSAFARPPAPQLESLDVARVLADVVRPYEGALPEGVTLRVDAGEAVPPVRADRRLLERAIVNLLENALQAIAGEGNVALTAAGRDGAVEIDVTDDGPGIDPDVRGRIFEPFFSTKTGGSGLGLALVKKIAEDHGGDVRLDSEPGRTRITLRLPAA